MHTPKLTSTIAAAIIGLTAAPALATENAPTAAVQTSDLDLTQQADQVRLEERTKRAVRAMCASNSRSVSALKMETKCRATALAQAETQIRVAVANANSGKVRLAVEDTSQTNG